MLRTLREGMQKARSPRAGYPVVHHSIYEAGQEETRAATTRWLLGRLHNDCLLLLAVQLPTTQRTARSYLLDVLPPWVMTADENRLFLDGCQQ